MIVLEKHGSPMKHLNLLNGLLLALFVSSLLIWVRKTPDWDGGFVFYE